MPWSLPSGATYRKIPIPEGNYAASQLTTELETQLNTYFDAGDRPDTYTVRYSARTNKTRISVNYTSAIFLVLTDGEMASFAGSFVERVDVSNLNSINRVMGNLTPAPDAYTSVVPYITNFIDLVPFKNLYLHCNEISNYNQLTVADSSSNIQKINVSVPYLGVINDNELSSVDYIDVANKLLRRYHLNQVVNLNGVDISFTLTFLGVKYINKFLYGKCGNH